MNHDRMTHGDEPRDARNQFVITRGEKRSRGKIVLVQMQTISPMFNVGYECDTSLPSETFARVKFPRCVVGRFGDVTLDTCASFVLAAFKWQKNDRNEYSPYVSIEILRF